MRLTLAILLLAITANGQPPALPAVTNKVHKAAFIGPVLPQPSNIVATLHWTASNIYYPPNLFPQDSEIIVLMRSHSTNNTYLVAYGSSTNHVRWEKCSDLIGDQWRGCSNIDVASIGTNQINAFYRAVLDMPLPQAINVTKQ